MSQTLYQAPMRVEMEGRVSYPAGTTVVEIVIPPGVDALDTVRAAIADINGILVSASTA